MNTTESTISVNQSNFSKITSNLPGSIGSLIWLALSVFIAVRISRKVHSKIHHYRKNLSVAVSILVFLFVFIVLQDPGILIFTSLLIYVLAFLGLSMILDTWLEVKGRNEK